jgi:hypothetical protein
MAAFFEICAHPYHSSERARSAVVILDSLVHSMSLSSLDAHDPQATTFSPGTPPIVSPQQHRHSISDFPTASECQCAEHSLGRVWPMARSITPLWLSTPAWIEEATEAELRKDQCRRLVWSSVMLIAGYTSYCEANQLSAELDLYLLDSSNVRTCLLAMLFSVHLCYAVRFAVSRRITGYNHRAREGLHLEFVYSSNDVVE